MKHLLTISSISPLLLFALDSPLGPLIPKACDVHGPQTLKAIGGECYSGVAEEFGWTHYSIQVTPRRVRALLLLAVIGCLALEGRDNPGSLR